MSDYVRHFSADTSHFSTKSDAFPAERIFLDARRKQKFIGNASLESSPLGPYQRESASLFRLRAHLFCGGVALDDQPATKAKTQFVSFHLAVVCLSGLSRRVLVAYLFHWRNKKRLPPKLASSRSPNFLGESQVGRCVWLCRVLANVFCLFLLKMP